MGLDIQAISFDKVSLDKEKYDIITFWDVLEHVTDPLSALNRSNKLLKKGGIIAINYPDINSIWARLLGKYWWFVVSVLKKMRYIGYTFELE